MLTRVNQGGFHPASSASSKRLWLLVASEDVIPFVLGAIDVTFYVRVFRCGPAAGLASCCMLDLLDKSLLQELRVRDEAFGFWHLSLVSIGQYNQDGGSCAIAEAAECFVFLY